MSTTREQHVRNPFPNEIEVDGDNYPSDASIENIRLANIVEDAGAWLVLTFPIFVEQIGYGHCNVYEGRDRLLGNFYVIHYSTGGWSGQESLINALEQNIAGLMYLESWHRGGHYTFHVPMSALEGVATDRLP